MGRAGVAGLRGRRQAGEVATQVPGQGDRQVEGQGQTVHVAREVIVCVQAVPEEYTENCGQWLPLERGGELGCVWG